MDREDRIIILIRNLEDKLLIKDKQIAALSQCISLLVSNYGINTDKINRLLSEVIHDNVSN